ncbi:hypothetical protein EON65_34665 [archaeon]|nr:MAG: hypothetical protein EON65_34665 [archaeon]
MDRTHMVSQLALHDKTLIHGVRVKKSPWYVCYVVMFSYIHRSPFPPSSAPFPSYVPYSST